MSRDIGVGKKFPAADLETDDPRGEISADEINKMVQAIEESEVAGTAKEIIGGYFDQDGTLGTKYMKTGKLSNTQFQQSVPGVSDIEHNMAWFNAAVKAVGKAEGWGTKTGDGGDPVDPPATGDYQLVTTSWQAANGVVRENAKITYTEQVRCITNLTLPAGIAGGVKFKSSDAAVIVSTNHNNYDGFSEAMYGSIRNPVNFKIQAFSHTAAEINHETDPIDPEEEITIIFTNTGGAGGAGEVIWYHADQEWERDQRVPGDFTLKSFGYSGGFLPYVQTLGFL